MAQTSSRQQEQDPAADKKDLRRKAKNQRAAAAAASPNAAVRLRDRLLADIAFPDGCTVSAYWPMRDEIDPLPTLEALHGQGHTIGLPVMPAKDSPLVFRAWHPGQALADGGYGTRIPPEDAPEVRPKVLLVPLLAFDRAGYRLGYGGGFYDRTLERLRRGDPDVRAIGIAYAGQEVPAVPRGPYDQPLDGIVTENGAIQLSDTGQLPGMGAEARS